MIDDDGFAEADLFTNLLIIAIVLLLIGIAQLRAKKLPAVPQTRQVVLALDLPSEMPWRSELILSDNSDLETNLTIPGNPVDSKSGERETRLSERCTCRVRAVERNGKQKVDFVFMFSGEDDGLPKRLIVKWWPLNASNVDGDETPLKVEARWLAGLASNGVAKMPICKVVLSENADAVLFSTAMDIVEQQGEEGRSFLILDRHCPGTVNASSPGASE